WTLPANGSATGSGSSNPASAIEYQIASGSTSGNGTFTLSANNNWSAAALAFAPASGGGGSGTPAFVQNVQTEGSGTSFTSSSMTVSSGDLLVAEVSLLNFSSAPDVSSIKLDGSTAFTVGKDVAMGSQYRVFLAYLPSVSAGS